MPRSGISQHKHMRRINMNDVTTSTLQESRIDSRALRDVLGHYPTGVVVVTGMSPEGAPLGMVVGTFSSVSLDPPMVSFMPTKNSETYAMLRQATTWCINVLAYDQQAETRTLAQRDPRKFDGVTWVISAHGAPRLDAAVAHIHCSLAQEIEAGDHLIVLCDVQDVEVSRPVTPLLFFQGGYGGFSTTASAAHVDSDLISAVRVAEAARPQLTALADRFDCEAVALIQINDHDQTIGAVARTVSVDTHERLGARMALIPPFGETSVAWSDEQTAKWLRRISPSDPEVAEMYRKRLAAVRSRGYTAHLLPAGREDDHRAFGQALHEYSLGQLTPARDRAVRSAIARAADFFPSEPFVDDAPEHVITLTVPVFDPTTTPQTNSGLVLRLGSMRKTITSAQARERVAALQQAAAEVSESLAGPHRGDLERYLNSGLRERT
ncbi:flavin reductase family protein [Microbacterium sp. A93]|uniref:flavin reductase family protein n=1 Tax=Microbacterium sp. A93 TaxID=3450716 RepID=UPI003F424759